MKMNFYGFVVSIARQVYQWVNPIDEQVVYMYVDKPAKGMRGYCAKYIHAADPVGMGRKLRQYTIF